MKNLLRRIIGIDLPVDEEKSLLENDPVTALLEEKARDKKPVKEYFADTETVKADRLPVSDPEMESSSDQVNPEFSDPLLLLIHETFSKPGGASLNESKYRSKETTLEMQMANSLVTASNTDQTTEPYPVQETVFINEADSEQLEIESGENKDQEAISVNNSPLGKQDNTSNADGKTGLAVEKNSELSGSGNPRWKRDNNISEFLTYFL